MIIRVLVDNETSCKGIGSEHGLSLLLEFAGRKVLFDFGQSQLLYVNADLMGVELSDVDYAILSHGHYDHGGGLNSFLNAYTDVPVYVRKNAFANYLAQREGGKLEYIGLPSVTKKRFVLTEEEHVIEKGIILFSVPPAERFQPSGNRTLFEKLENGSLVRDTFMHEQNLLIEKDMGTVLVTGCAHRGIVNILEWVRKKYHVIPQYVIGGFHLNHMLDDDQTEMLALRGIAEYLINTGAKYYTGHCTGLAPYKKLKDIMGDRIEYASAGKVLAINEKEQTNNE